MSEKQLYIDALTSVIEGAENAAGVVSKLVKKSQFSDRVIAGQAGIIRKQIKESDGYRERLTQAGMHIAALKQLRNRLEEELYDRTRVPRLTSYFDLSVDTITPIDYSRIRLRLQPMQQEIVVAQLHQMGPDGKRVFANKLADEMRDLLARDIEEQLARL